MDYTNAWAGVEPPPLFSLAPKRLDTLSSGWAGIDRAEEAGQKSTRKIAPNIFREQCLRIGETLDNAIDWKLIDLLY